MIFPEQITFHSNSLGYFIDWKKACQIICPFVPIVKQSCFRFYL